MPELPEVQALSESLEARLRGAVVSGVAMRSVSALKTYEPPLEALRGATFSGSGRAGKFLDLRIGGLHLVIHLARSGWLRLRERPTNARPSLRGPLLMTVSFADGRALEATEQGTEKRFSVYLVRALDEVPGIARLGVDALDESLTVERLRDILAGAPGMLKNALADQAIVAGVGNAYSDEILHAAKLSPFRKASSLDAADSQRLHAALRDVLRDALARARDADPDALRGDKKLRMRVHGRTGERCPVCGDLVREVSYTSRSFQYCATCQTGGRVYADRRLSRLLR